MTDRSQNGVRAERVLVVDDEEAIRTIIVSFLVAADYECREAASGLEALSLLSGDTFDLVLYDLMMPLHNFDGIGLMERTTKQYPDMPVVIVTAVHDISIALATMRNGAFDYLTKPFERAQLLNAVGRALENRRLKLDHRAYVSSLEAQVATLTEELPVRKSSRRFCNSL
jgi:DNA-binding NtrC family response regulator